MRCDECIPGDRVHNPNTGIRGIVLDVRKDEVKIRWHTGRRTPTWTSNVEHIDRIREGRP